MCSFEQPPPPSLSTWFVYTCSHIILRFCAVVWKNFKVVGILTGFWKKRLKKGPKKYKCHNSSPFRNRYNSWGLIWCYIVKYVIFCKTLKLILNSILQHFTLFFLQSFIIPSGWRFTIQIWFGRESLFITSHLWNARVSFDWLWIFWGSPWIIFNVCTIFKLFHVYRVSHFTFVYFDWLAWQ